MKHQNLWMHPFKVWGKLHDREARFLILNLLQLFHYIANSELNASVNWFQNWINFAVKFFHWVYKTPPWTWLQQKQTYKQATLSNWKTEHINKWDGAANVPHTKRAEGLDILTVRERLLTKCLDGQIQRRMC